MARGREVSQNGSPKKGSRRRGMSPQSIEPASITCLDQYNREATFRLSDIKDVTISEDSRTELVFFAGSKKVRLSAASDGEARAWYRSLTSALSKGGKEQHSKSTSWGDAELVALKKGRVRVPSGDDDVVERIRSELRVTIEEIGVDATSLCEYIETDDEDMFDVFGLESFIRKDLKIKASKMPDHDIEQFFKALDAKGDGEVELDEFVAFIGLSSRTTAASTMSPMGSSRSEILFADDRGKKKTSPKSARSLSEGADDSKAKKTSSRSNLRSCRSVKGGSVDEAISKVKRRIKMATQGGRASATEVFFAQINSDGSGELDADAWFTVIRKHLRLGAGEVSDQQIDEMFSVFDEDESGTVSLAELSAVLNPASDEKTQKAASSRLQEMYMQYEAKLEKNRAKAKLKEEAELKKIEQSKWRGGGRKVVERYDPNSALRMHQAAYAKEERMRELRRQYADQRQLELEESRKSELPTRSKNGPLSGNSARITQRLYVDAERRDRERQLAKDQSDWEEQEGINKWTRRRNETDIDQNRHLNLYQDAAARRLRLEQKQIEAAEAKRKEYETNMIHSSAQRKSPNPERISELYMQHSERMRKLATQVSQKNMREIDEFNTLYRSSPNRARPSVCDDVRSPRSVRSPTRMDSGQQLAIESPKKKKEQAKGQTKEQTKDPSTVVSQKCSKPFFTQAESTVYVIVTSILTRCNYHHTCDTVTDFDIRPMVSPLAAAIEIYKDALKNCEVGEGFCAISARASERLFHERLLPEHEGAAKNMEPDPIRQIQDDLDDLLVTAKKAQAVLMDSIACGVAWTPGVAANPHPVGVPTALFAYDPGVKSERAARAKARVRYGPSEGENGYRHLLDLARLLLVFSNCDMLLAGLGQIQRRFEVVDIRNYFRTPNRMGLRYIEVLVIVQVGQRADEMTPHVCEIRLEEICFFKAREMAFQHVEHFMSLFERQFTRHGRDTDALLYLARSTLFKPSCPHDIRVFRCHLNKRFGSTICAWRQHVVGQRNISFNKFREICYSLNCGEHSTEFWIALDPSLAGCISIFDLDPEAVSLLTKLRSRLLAMASVDGGQELDSAALFARLCFLVRPRQAGQLEIREFRLVVQPLGITVQEADKIFSYLDRHAGVHHPATITAADIHWLNRLDRLVDLECVTLSTENALNEVDELRQISWARVAARRNKRGEILRWSVLEDDARSLRRSQSADCDDRNLDVTWRPCAARCIVEEEEEEGRGGEAIEEEEQMESPSMFNDLGARSSSPHAMERASIYRHQPQSEIANARIEDTDIDDGLPRNETGHLTDEEEETLLPQDRTHILEMSLEHTHTLEMSTETHMTQRMMEEGSWDLEAHEDTF